MEKCFFSNLLCDAVGTFTPEMNGFGKLYATSNWNLEKKQNGVELGAYGKIEFYWILRF